MIIINNSSDIPSGGLAVTIGFFDGVHLGHRFLIDELKRVATARGLPSAVITFREHPRKVLRADYQPRLLNSFGEKMEHLGAMGVDYCIVPDFTPELSRLSAREFITTVLAEKMHARALLIGYDHRFGHDRADGFPEYVRYGAACGIEVIEASRFEADGLTVSSSEIRKQLAACHVEEAAHLLTYPYRLKGTIIGGHKVGRKLGFPTANILVDEPCKVIPGTGVYAVWVYIASKRYKGMLYIGNRPTLHNGEDITPEVNIFDFDGDIYNKGITATFMYYIRGDIRFDTLEELREQLVKDKIAVEERLITKLQ